jgi:acetyltransferase-like isoleucine patch superfamily enzyme
VINTAAVVEHDTIVEEFAFIAPHATIAGGARVGRLSLIGIGAVVLPGVNVGSETIVGAGAVVTRDLPDGVVASGVPARIRHSVAEEIASRTR